MASFHLQITTADGMEFDGQVDRLVVRTTEGDVGIMRGHVDYLAALKDVSEMRITTGNEVRTAALSGGFVSVTKDITRVNATTLEWADEIDVKRAEASAARAQNVIADKSAADTDIRLAEARLKRALVRKSVAGYKSK